MLYYIYSLFYMVCIRVGFQIETNRLQGEIMAESFLAS